MSREDFYEISPADFFYRNRDIAGFSNPARAIYSAVRELVENSLDAAELYRFHPEIYIRITTQDGSNAEGVAAHVIRVEDNGSGVPARHIPSAFGQVFYGSKYKLRQSRGTFGLGGTMAILYSQITTDSPVNVISSVGDKYIHEYALMIDIQRNRPVILAHKTYGNVDGWHGTIIELKMEGDYSRASAKVIEYLKQTSIVAPYANITLIDPRGRLLIFERVTEEQPKPPEETKPHPYGSDVETLKRMLTSTESKDLISFITTHFYGVGEKTALNFLAFAGIPSNRRPRNMSNEDVVKLAKKMKEFPGDSSYQGFRSPSASCLSPLGENLMKAGIMRELNPEFISVKMRNPSVYGGYPFIIEVALAYGGGIPAAGDIMLYRFANRIPLLYDEASDVSWKVVHTFNWRHYNIDPSLPLAVLTHICSTKIPYRSVGKEFVADVPEIEREIQCGLRDAARELSSFLTKRRALETEKRRFDIFERFLPKIAKFSAEMAGKPETPDVKLLLKTVMKYGPEEIDES